MKKKKEEEKILVPKDHKLVTRRDFLSHGLISGSGFVMAPTLLGALATKEVYGAENCFQAVDLSQRKTPIIMIDLSGGGSIPGSNVMVGDAGGQHSYINDYGRLGLPSSLNPTVNGMINSDMGLKFHSQSGMLEGISNHASQAIRQKCEGAVFCAVSSDDTSNNPHNPMYWLNKAGSFGDIAQTAGTRNGRSGGRSIIPALSYDPTIAPVAINSPNDCVNLISLGQVHDLFDDVKAKRVLQTIQNMSNSKLNTFSQKSLPEQIKEVAECGFAKDNVDQRVHNTAQRFTSAAIDPREDSAVNSIYTNLNNNEQRKQASIAKLVLDGYIGTGTIELGGFDYHGRTTRVAQEDKDREAGEAIGRILALAAAKQSDVMIYVYTDGGISSNQSIVDENANGKFKFTNDDGQRAATFMLSYQHSGGRPSLRHGTSGSNTVKRQVGHVKADSNVEKNANVLSNNVTNLAKAVVANYLARHGEESKLEEIVGDNPFGNNINDYLIF
jgi:hypothetical protein